MPALSTLETDAMELDLEKHIAPKQVEFAKTMAKKTAEAKKAKAATGKKTEASQAEAVAGRTRRMPSGGEPKKKRAKRAPEEEAADAAMAAK